MHSPFRLSATALLCLTLGACQLLSSAPETSTSGFGQSTRGGLDGQVIKVSNLNPSGAGSLRAALEAKGPRLVVFEVGGTIDLDKQDLKITEPFLTIAGQTAPTPGITLIRGGLQIQAHDVKMQHLRLRIGDAGMPKKSGYEKDVSIEGPHAWNVVVDHCSVSWGTDENLSVSGPRYDGPQGTAHKVTLSNNIIAEGLLDASHSKGKHSMGSLVHDNVSEVAILGNLYAHNNDRNPWFKGGSTGVIVNNYVYNPGTWAIRLGYNPKEWEGRSAPPAPRVAIVGNVLQHGADTPADKSFIGSNAPELAGAAFIADNLALRRDGSAAPMLSGLIETLSAPPVWPLGLSARPASKVREAVLAQAGARPLERDDVDLRLIAEIRRGQGHHRNSQDEVGGYPHNAPSQRSLQVPDRDREAWLEAFSARLEGR